MQLRNHIMCDINETFHVIWLKEYKYFHDIAQETIFARTHALECGWLNCQ